MRPRFALAQTGASPVPTQNPVPTQTSVPTRTPVPHYCLRSYGHYVEGAVGSGEAEAVGRVDEWRKGDIHPVDGESGIDLVQDAIGAGHVDQGAIHGDVGGNGSSVVGERDSGCGGGVEVIDQD